MSTCGLCFPPMQAMFCSLAIASNTWVTTQYCFLLLKTKLHYIHGEILAGALCIVYLESRKYTAELVQIRGFTVLLFMHAAVILWNLGLSGWVASLTWVGVLAVNSDWDPGISAVLFQLICSISRPPSHSNMTTSRSRKTTWWQPKS